MPTLDPLLRDQLAAVIIGNIGKENQDDGARAIAEAGARAAIKSLAVHLSKPFDHDKNDPDKIRLRNRLRARARQLGDARNADGGHEFRRLEEQAAYEHWHRMLFARFLAENNLLIHPEMKVPVTLEECTALAASEGAADAWELAGRYASRMLPGIFRPDDPVLALRFAPEHQHELEQLLASLPAELFRASDSLGWCYQFWQARRKKEVNASEVKIGADELPAVTQLFTDPYMVQFILHNTLGAWWVGAGRTLPVEMPYLRRLDDGTPSAGTFEGWPRLARELKVLDPCCGSGHFLVAAFEILVTFRMAEEGISAREACDAVLRDNLFGLEIDYRCVQIAAFALALAAWTYPGAGGYRALAPMNVACSGLAISAKKEEWEKLAGDNQRLRNGMGRMWDLFRDAPILGSLIDPTASPPDPILAAGFSELRPLLSAALNAESSTMDPEAHEVRVAARGIADAAWLLGGAYDLVVTNVPYLLRRKQNSVLQSFLDDKYTGASTDLGASFVWRCSQMLRSGGTTGLVAPQQWLTLVSYAGLRKHLLASTTWNLLAVLGTGAFETISGAVVNVCLWIGSRLSPELDHGLMALDLSTEPETRAKAARLMSDGLVRVSQNSQLRNPDHRIVLETGKHGALLNAYVKSIQGIVTGDDPRFKRCFWEVMGLTASWRRIQSTSHEGREIGGLHGIVYWGDDGQGLARLQGMSAWGKHGIIISQMESLAASLYMSQAFDVNTSALVTDDPSVAIAVFAYCRSPEYRNELRKIDRALKVTTATLAKVPFDYERWTAIAAEQYPDGLPLPTSADPTQWVFAGHPRTSDAPLQVAVARLLGFSWPDQQPDTLDSHSDVDGIVCIPALRSERLASARLTDLIAAAWGKDWHPQILTDLLAAVGHTGDLEEWLRDAFFKQHCEVFHHRPFIWHIWDGHREGFSALVNYHKLDHKTLKSLTYTYLGDWIRTQEIEAKAGKSGAGDKLAKAKALQQRLAAILEGEAPLDIFVRWKPIEQQPIGWYPDLDDGVRLNIRPFMTVADVGARGAGVLRWKPNIKWGKDRGKNPPDSPWGEDRDNDKHLTLAEKSKAREAT